MHDLFLLTIAFASVLSFFLSLWEWFISSYCLLKWMILMGSNWYNFHMFQIATATKREDKVVGTHFFAPAYIMKLLENIYGPKTSAETVATVMKLGKRIKKVKCMRYNINGYYMYVFYHHFMKWNNFYQFLFVSWLTKLFQNEVFCKNKKLLLEEELVSFKSWST